MLHKLKQYFFLEPTNTEEALQELLELCIDTTYALDRSLDRINQLEKEIHSLKSALLQT